MHLPSGCAPPVSPEPYLWRPCVGKRHRFPGSDLWPDQGVYPCLATEHHAGRNKGAGLGPRYSGLRLRRGPHLAAIQGIRRALPHTHHRAYCLYFAQGTYGKCMDRCPGRAITESGHDKERCRRHLASTREYVRRIYGFEGYGCGVCQAGVPCEAGIPVMEARKALERGEIPPQPPSVLYRFSATAGEIDAEKDYSRSYGTHKGKLFPEKKKAYSDAADRLEQGGHGGGLGGDVFLALEEKRVGQD